MIQAGMIQAGMVTPMSMAMVGAGEGGNAATAPAAQGDFLAAFLALLSTDGKETAIPPVPSEQKKKTPTEDEMAMLLQMLGGNVQLMNPLLQEQTAAQDAAQGQSAGQTTEQGVLAALTAGVQGIQSAGTQQQAQAQATANSLALLQQAQLLRANASTEAAQQQAQVAAQAAGVTTATNPLEATTSAPSAFATAQGNTVVAQAIAEAQLQPNSVKQDAGKQGSAAQQLSEIGSTEKGQPTQTEAEALLAAQRTMMQQSSKTMPTSMQGISTQKESTRAEAPEQELQKTKTNLEELQRQVEEGAFLPQSRFGTIGNAAQVQHAARNEAEPMLEQLKTGLMQGMKDGDNAFIIKLRPEGLGEITVRLTTEAGKTVLDLTASSQQTARLIQSELPSLRETLRPLGAEVGQVSHSETGFDASQYAQQQMRQNQQQQQQQLRHALFFGGDAQTEDVLEPTLAAVAMSGGGSINYYV